MFNIKKNDLEFKIGMWPFYLSLILHFLPMAFHFEPLRWGQLEKNTSWQPVEIIKINDLKKIKALSRQIVQSDPTGPHKKDPNTRFLGKKTQSFDRQSVSSIIGSYREAGRGDTTDFKKVGEEKTAVRTDKKLSLSALGNIAMKKGPSPKKQRKKLGLVNGNKNSRGLASRNDFIEEVPLGDFTKLNTIEFKHFGFYQRIRRKLEQHWGFSLRQKTRVLRGRRISSNENYITSLIITLNKQGNITQVYLKGTSGIQELDDAAIESFNKAGPFPNPPQEMLKGGQARIKWSFVVRS